MIRRIGFVVVALLVLLGLMVIRLVQMTWWTIRLAWAATRPTSV